MGGITSATVTGEVESFAFVPIVLLGTVAGSVAIDGASAMGELFEDAIELSISADFDNSIWLLDDSTTDGMLFEVVVGFFAVGLQPKAIETRASAARGEIRF